MRHHSPIASLLPFLALALGPGWMPVLFCQDDPATPMVTPGLFAEDRPQLARLHSTRARWALRVLEKDAKTPIVGASVWSSYMLGEEYLPLPDAITNARGEAAIDLTEIRALRPIEQASVVIDAYVASAGYITDSTLVFADDLLIFEGGTDRGPPSVVTLETGRCLTGKVLDASGAPVHDAQLTAGIWDSRAGEWTSELESSCGLGWTEAGGHYSFELGECNFTELFASHHRAGIGSILISAASLDEAVRDGRELSLEQPRLFLRGTLLALDGQQVGRPQLIVEYDGDGSSPYADSFDVPIDENGHFEVACPRAGAWSVTTDYSFSERVEPGAGDLRLLLPGIHVVIRVVDEQGQRVRGHAPRVHALIPTSAGLRPDYRGKHGGEFSTVWSSWESPNSSGGGVWTCRLPRAGTYSLSLRLDGGLTSWFAATHFEVEPGTHVVEETLVLREIPRIPPIEVEYLDEHGRSIPDWRGSLYSATSGLQLDRFTRDGSEHPTCMGTSYDQLSWLAGNYRLRLEPAPGGYALPVESAIMVQAAAPHRLTLHSPGIGGRLLVTSAERDSERSTHVTIELTHLASGRRLEPEWLYRDKRHGNFWWASSPGASFGAASRLMRAGEWSWRLHEHGEPRGTGTLRIRAGEDTGLIVDLGD